MAGRASPPKRVLRRLPPPPRAPGRLAGLRVRLAAMFARLLSRPRRAAALIAARLAPFNPRAHRRCREAATHLIALARELQEEYAASATISFSLVYRLEAAQAALTHALDAICPPTARPRPDTERTRMATALLEVVHLAQLAREWQQDVINLQHTLATDAMDDDQRTALVGGVKHLQGYVSQNMHDLGRWLQAAEQLRG